MKIFDKLNSLVPDYQIFGIGLVDYLLAFLAFVVIYGVLKLFKIIVIARLKKFFRKTKTDIDDAFINAIELIGWPFYFFTSVYFSVRFIPVPEKIDKWFLNVFLIIVVFYVIQFLGHLLDFGTKKMIEKKEADKSGQSGIIRMMSVLIKIVLWIGALILILANLGYNVTSLIASLGIGGIAVGLALQNILGDLFSSLAIHLDKPFKKGDFIVVGDKYGTVKHIGIKTTRLAALQGEEIVLSNTDMTSSRIQNFGLMEERRVVFSLGVSYDTPLEKLKQIPGMIEEIIKNQDKLKFDRVNFNQFGDSSLNFEIVYYIASSDYNEHMSAQEKINLAIFEKFQENKIEIAYPTRTVFVKKD